MNLQAVNSMSEAWSAAMLRTLLDGGLFIAALWLAVRIFPRIPVTVRCWLWWIACAKLLLSAVIMPVALPLLPARTVVATPSVQSQTLVPSNVVPIARGHRLSPGSAAPRENAAVQAATPAAAPKDRAGTNPATWLFLLWSMGVLAWTVSAVRQALQVRRIVRNLRYIDKSARGVLARQLGIRIGLARPPRIALSDSASSPLVVGIAQPTIVLPASLEAALSEQELDALVAHEAAHIRRWDLWLAWVPTIAQALFYFYPPAWLACREWMIAQEASCDSAAIEATGANPSDYGDLLVRIGSDVPQAPLLPALGATSHYHTLRRRLLLIRAARAVLGLAERRAATLLCLVAALLVIPWRLTARVPANVTAPPWADPAPQYRLTDLGTLGGEESQARGINDSGVVVGWSCDSDHLFRPTAWVNGRIRPLAMPAGVMEGDATAINNAGVIAVTCFPYGQERHACLTGVAARPVSVITLSREAASQPRAINNTGMIAGAAGRHAFSARACAWLKGVEYPLQVPNCEQAFVYGINDAGHAVGAFYRHDGKDHALVWKDGEYEYLDALQGESSQALAINNKDQIVGFAIPPGKGNRAFLVSGGSTYDLGTLPGGYKSCGTAINDYGLVVGYSETPYNEMHAVIWGPSHGIVDLNSLVRLPGGWVLKTADGINGSGQIVGTAEVGGKRRAFLVTPTRSPLH